MYRPSFCDKCRNVIAGAMCAVCGWVAVVPAFAAGERSDDPHTHEEAPRPVSAKGVNQPGVTGVTGPYMPSGPTVTSGVTGVTGPTGSGPPPRW
jgi:hypothetical protein